VLGGSEIFRANILQVILEYCTLGESKTRLPKVVLEQVAWQANVSFNMTLAMPVRWDHFGCYNSTVSE